MEVEYSVDLTRGDYLKFNDEEVAKFIYLFLKKFVKVTTSELHSLKFPSVDKIKYIMKRYEMDKEKLIEQKGRINSTQKELDDIVSKEIYNLSNDELQIINKFLNTW